MESLPMLDTITPLGLVALVIILGYLAAKQVSGVLTAHYERQQTILNQILLEMVKCAEELEDIKESFQKRDNN